MTHRESQLTGLLRLHHLQETTEAADWAMAEERPRFAALAKDSAAPRSVSAFNLFQTPPALADRMASLADLSGRILEPSAGLGRIYSAVRSKAAGDVVLVEIAQQLCRELYLITEGDDRATLLQADFLQCTAERLGAPFDAVVMNPPFKQGRDISHIRHALSMLAPNGRLVALCYNGARQRRQLRSRADSWEELPGGMFDDTRASAVLLTMSA